MKILEKFNLKDKKNLLLGILIVGVISMTVAFAALTSRLTLNGTANVAATRWNIHFDNWEKVSIPTVTVGGNTQQNTAQSPAVNQLSTSDNSNVTKVTGISVTLNQPGDIAKYTFEIVNEGTIDAKLDSFTPTITNNSNDLIGYTVACYETNARTGNAITTDYVLGVNERVYCLAEVKYNDRTNSNEAGTNQRYEQSAVSTTISAEWIWVQADSSQSSGGGGNTPSGICQGGQMIKDANLQDTNWCLTNPSASLQNQRFAYYTNGTTQIMSGLQTIDDLYGISQTYYFVDGIAQVGLQTVNNNIYYFSDDDDDGNNYLNCNMLKNTTKTVSGTCYSFNANGVGTVDGPGCSGGGNANTYSYVGIYDSAPESGNSLSNNWVAWVKKNTTTGAKEVCQKFENATVCLESGRGNDSSYIQQKITEFENAMGEVGSCSSEEGYLLDCAAEYIEFGEEYYPDVECKIDSETGGVECGSSSGYSCNLGFYDEYENWDSNYIGCNGLTISN